MGKGRTSGPVDGFELSGMDVKINKNNRMKKRRIYQLGLIMPCQENDDECKDDEAESR
jgi:hypothetical protein